MQNYKQQARFVPEIFHYQEVDSTNTIALNLAAKGAPEGTVVTADVQNAGRGQRQRTWNSPRDRGLYYSIIVRPGFDSAKTSVITLLAGIAVVDTICEGYKLTADLKWPNDVLIAGKKVAGILTESVWTATRIDYIVIGIGINLDFQPGDFPKNPLFPATSLHHETSERIAKSELVSKLTGQIASWYHRLDNGTVVDIIDNWTKRSSMIGKVIDLDYQNELYRGKVRGLNETGSLILETEADGVLSFISGTVRSIGISPDISQQ